MARTLRSALLFFCLPLLPGCLSSGTPEPLLFGKDACAHCRMLLTDRRFGAEIVTEKGKTFKFDTLECLHAFEASEKEKLGSAPRRFLLDSLRGELIPAEKALIAEKSSLRSPMGRGFLVADSPEELQKLFGEEKIPATHSWAELDGRIDSPAAAPSH